MRVMNGLQCILVSHDLEPLTHEVDVCLSTCMQTTFGTKPPSLGSNGVQSLW